MQNERPDTSLLELLDTVRFLRRGIIVRSDADELSRRLCNHTGDSAGLLIVREGADGGVCSHTFCGDAENPVAPLTSGDCRTLLATLLSISKRTRLEQQEQHTVRALFRSLGGSDGVCVELYSPFEPSLLFCVYLEHGQLANSTQSTMNTLIPYLADAFATRRALSALSEPLTEDISSVLVRVDGHAHISVISREITLSRSAVDLWSRKLGPLKKQDVTRIERMIYGAAERFLASFVFRRSQMLAANVRVEFAFQSATAHAHGELLALLLDEDNLPAMQKVRRPPGEQLLTERQRQVARLMASGSSMQGIAEHLDISLNTVRTHIKAVYRRLGITKQTDLVSLMNG